jgi:hypothetical protein
MLNIFNFLKRSRFVEVKASSGQRKIISQESYISKVIENRKDFEWMRWLQ